MKFIRNGIRFVFCFLEHFTIPEVYCTMTDEAYTGSTALVRQIFTAQTTRGIIITVLQPSQI